MAIMKTLLLLILGCCIGIISCSDSYVSNFTLTLEGELVPKEKVKIIAEIISTKYRETLLHNFHIAKRQGDQDEFVNVCNSFKGDSSADSAPSTLHENMKNGDYKCETTFDGTKQIEVTPYKVIWELVIEELTAADSGEYIIEYHNQQDNSWRLNSKDRGVSVNIVVPAQSSTSNAKIETTAVADQENVYVFDVAHQVSCTTTAQSNSEDYYIKMTYDQDEVTTQFENGPIMALVWDGIAPLKVPKREAKVIATEYLPKGGTGELSCQLFYGQSQVAEEGIEVFRKENTHLNCTSNYLKPIKEGDENVLITCKVLEYAIGANQTVAVWEFIAEDEEVTLISGQSGYSRDSYLDNDAHVLRIPTVRKDMVFKMGKAATYNVTLYTNATSGENVLAHASIDVMVDGTAKVTNGASAITVTIFTLCSTVLVACKLL